MGAQERSQRDGSGKGKDVWGKGEMTVDKAKCFGGCQTTLGKAKSHWMQRNGKADRGTPPPSDRGAVTSQKDA